MKYLLSDLHEKGLPSLTEEIRSVEEWETKRTEIFKIWNQYIGGIPERPKVNYDVISSQKQANHIRLKIIYNSVYDDKVPAYLLVPSKEIALNKAVLAMHPTAESGKDDISLTDGRENRRYALELAEAGFTVLAPDTITAGERIDKGEKPYNTASFVKRYPQWSPVAKMITDHIQGIDLLCSFGFAPNQKVGVIGHSLGGYNSFFAAAHDKRIAAVVSSCGFATFAEDTQTMRWGTRDWFSHIPSLTEDIEKGRVPFEFHEIAALTAPVPFFNWNGQFDKIFPHWRPTAEAMIQLKELYETLGKGDCFVSLLGSTGHDFPLYIRKAAYDFLNYHLS